MTLNTRFFLALVSATVAFISGAEQIGAAEAKESPAETQQNLIALMKSSAPPAEKAMACKRLAIYGTAEAVPVLAPLLADPDLASWARIALEVIPGPAADEALRQAMGKLQGRLLVGTINSIGVRRDAKAVKGLAAKLNESDSDVVSAAGVALGRIGGEPAAKALEAVLAKSPPAVRPALAEGAIRCAERFVADGKRAEAVRLYDFVRKAEVPKQKLLEATRGAILARQSAGLPLLLEQLRSPDKGYFSIGLRTARELPGAQVTEALAAEIRQTSPERQSMLLLALADRTEGSVMPTVLACAEKGAKPLRLTAVGILERAGNVSSVPVLLAAATDADTELAQAAVTGLTRLPGNGVDAELRDRLLKSEGNKRRVLIEVAGQRRLEGTLPVILRCAEDRDAATRTAALRTLGAVGEDRELAELVKLVKKAPAEAERSQIETALLAISGRRGGGCTPNLVSLTKSDDSSLRILGLHALASAGGSEALTSVKAALADKEESVQDEAVRTLASWPNTWPDDQAVAEPLLTLAKSSNKPTHQVLGLRGYLQYIQGDKKLKNEEKVEKVNEVLPNVQRAEEKRLAVSVVRAVPTASALKLLAHFAADPAVAEEACSAIVSNAGTKLSGVAEEERRRALQAVLDHSDNESTKKKAGDILKRMP